MGWGDGNSGWAAGIGPHRKAGSKDDVLDSTPSRVKARCQLQGGRAARVLLATACRILSEFSVACLERFPRHERKWCQRRKAGENTHANINPQRQCAMGAKYQASAA